MPVLMLVRISLRIIPERVNTFSVWLDAFEPSAGYGPAVSWGIWLTQLVVDVGVGVAVAPPIGVEVALAVGVAVALVVGVAVDVAAGARISRK